MMVPKRGNGLDGGTAPFRPWASPKTYMCKRNPLKTAKPLSKVPLLPQHICSDLYTSMARMLSAPMLTRTLVLSGTLIVLVALFF